MKLRQALAAARVAVAMELATVVVQKGPACPGGQVTLSWLQRLLDPP